MAKKKQKNEYVTADLSTAEEPTPEVQPKIITVNWSALRVKLGKIKEHLSANKNHYLIGTSIVVGGALMFALTEPYDPDKDPALRAVIDGDTSEENSEADYEVAITETDIVELDQ